MKAGEMIYVTEGSRIILQDEAYVYSYAFFSLKRPEEYLYTYAYQEEEHWCTYEEIYSVKEFLDTDTVFDERNLPPEKEGYICVSVVLRGDREPVSPADLPIIVKEGVGSLRDKEKKYLQRADVQQEIERITKKVQEKRTENSLVFPLLSDTHYVCNGNWEITAAVLEAVCQEVMPDGMIHLGDFTDGILSKEVCAMYSGRVINRLKALGLPLYICIGNHDANYFRNNPDRLTDQEQYELYLENNVSGELVKDQLWYHADLPKHKLRMLFLHSYKHEEKLRYGFEEREIQWVKERLTDLPEDYKVILFSHDAPLARLDYWASDIHNGEALMEVLENWHTGHENRILAFIHGHTHADLIYKERKFPIISVGCSKLEYFEDKKPEGAVTPVREEGTLWQELWDIMILHPEEKKIEFIRFGAGVDRQICMDVPESSEESVKEAVKGVVEESGKESVNVCVNNSVTGGKHSCKIWAHRGASGYAPENTLEAFRLAAELGADGVELDVQLTKDRKLVVIHDERIDRTSDGKGYVKDYTLEELRRYNYQKIKPAYPHADIPTLQEVLEVLKPTDLTINIELKTGINFYPGIERMVIELVGQMGMEERVIYSSFNHASILKVKELSPMAKTGLLYCDGTLDMADYAKKHGVEALHPACYNVRYPGFVKKCKEEGIALHVWTANDRKQIQELLQYDVDAVITNYPDVAYEVIHGRHIDPAEILGAKNPRQGILGTGDSNSKAGVSGAERSGTKLPKQESSSSGQTGSRHKNPLLHGMGVLYGKVRKVFVAIDRAVQRAAGR